MDMVLSVETGLQGKRYAFAANLATLCPDLMGESADRAGRAAGIRQDRRGKGPHWAGGRGAIRDLGAKYFSCFFLFLTKNRKESSLFVL
jgi:hypothetical protein